MRQSLASQSLAKDCTYLRFGSVIRIIPLYLYKSLPFYPVKNVNMSKFTWLISSYFSKAKLMIIRYYVETVRLVYTNIAWEIQNIIGSSIKHEKIIKLKGKALRFLMLLRIFHAFHNCSLLKNRRRSDLRMFFLNPCQKIENLIWAGFEEKPFELLLMQSMDFQRKGSHVILERVKY